MKLHHHAFELYRKIDPEHFDIIECRVDWDIEDQVNAADPEIAAQIHSEQHGGEFHGKLVVAGHFLLVEEFDRYPDLASCFQVTEVEGEIDGLKPDILDRENKIILECGFVNGGEDMRSFLLKCVEYSYRIPNISNWDFIHIPKSFFSDGDDSHCQLGDSEFRVIRFSSEADDYIQDFKEMKNKEEQRDVKEMARKLREFDEDNLN